MPLQKYEMIAINTIEIVIFLSAIWLPHSQLWTITEGGSLTHPMLITAFLHI